jgi:hypothetical protein
VDGAAPHTKNCDTVRLAIRLRSRRISCSFGLSRLAEKAGSYRDCPARYEKSHLPHMSRAACHAGRVLIRLPPRIGYNASVVRPQAQRLFPPARGGDEEHAEEVGGTFNPSGRR